MCRWRSRAVVFHSRSELVPCGPSGMQEDASFGTELNSTGISVRRQPTDVLTSLMISCVALQLGEILADDHAYCWLSLALLAYEQQNCDDRLQ